MPKAARALTAFAAALIAGTSCRREAAKEEPAPSLSTPPKAAVAAPLAGERIDIPGGAFKAGSPPGEAGRRPEVEERSTTAELGPYRIDRLPYPNDPSQPARTLIARGDAERLCEERGARLCTELEWERACKGPESHRFASGDIWDERCAKAPRSCASSFDVLSMGSLREWTASDVIPEGEGPRKAALRGAAVDAPSDLRRCAARSAEKPELTSDTLGFRCCKGARNAALVVEPRAGQTFAQASITPTRVAELLKSSPRTEAIAKDVRFFREPDSAETVVSRGPGDRKGFLFTVAPLLWNPVAGAEFLVVTGRSGESTSFVAVFHVLGKDEYRLASSFVMKSEVGPVALAYNGYIRPRLHFSTCWGCPGESGKILYRDPDGAVIVQP